MTKIPVQSTATPDHPLIEAVIAQSFQLRGEFQQFNQSPAGAKTDFLFATPDDVYDPIHIFPCLRWGGQFVFCSPHHRQVEALARQFGGQGFCIEQQPSFVRIQRTGLLRPFPGKRVHYFVARKILQILPGQITHRFTYDVQLLRHNDQYVVSKSVPSLESIILRLQRRFPDLPDRVIEAKARKFTDKIFPLFLTREAAMLQILQRDLPRPYELRIPRVIEMEKDPRGFVRRFTMNWLRNSSQPISQIEFARQSADLLHILHDKVGVIHLDLRLDNFVITEHGVGFVDFGSAVRVGEDLSKNPLLGQLFDELMRTSQIQIMLEKMTTSGLVTSHAIRSGYRKVEKSVDLFYLAVQFNAPHSNPDLKPLIQFVPRSAEAMALSQLTQQILKPADPANPPYKSALDILRGVIHIKDQLASTST